MKPKLAKRRYMSAMMGSSLAYLAATFGVSFLHNPDNDGTAFGIVLSAIPAIFLLMMVWSVWRYLGEMDEVARFEHTQAMIAGLFAVLAITGGWGLVELFNDSLPRLPMFFVFPFFFIVFGLVSCLKYKRWA